CLIEALGNMGSLAGLAGPLGLDPADRVGGGPADGAGVVAAQVDGDGVPGDVDGDDAPGVDAPEGDLLPSDHDDAGVAGPPLHGHRFGRWPRWGPGGARVRYARWPHDQELNGYARF